MNKFNQLNYLLLALSNLMLILSCGTCPDINREACLHPKFVLIQHILRVILCATRSFERAPRFGLAESSFINCAVVPNRRKVNSPAERWPQTKQN